MPHYALLNLPESFLAAVKFVCYPVHNMVTHIVCPGNRRTDEQKQSVFR